MSADTASSPKAMAEVSETLGKRKRTTRVSYVEPEYDFDEDDVADEDAAKADAAFYNGELDNSDDEDITYSSRKVGVNCVTTHPLLKLIVR